MYWLYSQEPKPTAKRSLYLVFQQSEVTSMPAAAALAWENCHSGSRVPSCLCSSAASS